MRINVVLPTRGLVFSEAMQALLDNLQGYEYRIFMSSDKVIPDGHNELTQKALEDNPDFILLNEEDTCMPEGGLDDMVMAKADIACIDYGVSGYSCITRDSKTNEILWCGVGCTLVNRKVFDTLKMPYFRSDIQLLLNNYPKEEWINAPKNAYGGHDIYFCTMARKAGFTITQVKGECKHLRLDSLGRPEVNRGLHSISQKPMISKYQTLPL